MDTNEQLITFQYQVREAWIVSWTCAQMLKQRCHLSRWHVRGRANAQVRPINTRQPGVLCNLQLGMYHK